MNPFTSKTFTDIWLRHFNDSKPEIRFKFLKDIGFVKNKYLPLYVNVGKNLTNGLSYNIAKEENDYKGKVFFIYDIPEYFNVVNEFPETLKLKARRQYKGYLVNLSKYASEEVYLSDHFSTKSRWKINKSKRRLESCFNIKYGVLYGSDTLKEDYDRVFNYYNALLKKRFTEKQINNHYLAPRKWRYLQELIYPMILEKKAAIFVIYSDDEPISVYLNYVSDNILFSKLPVFDSDYSKFNIGYIDNLKHIEWCIKNNIEIFDFSKGDYDYKKRLSNKAYYFHYHVLYDSKSIRAVFLYLIIFFFFYIKQFLRDNNFHILFHKIVFFLKRNKKTTIEPHGYKNYNIEEIPNEKNLVKLDFQSVNDPSLKKAIIDFFYKSSESVNSTLIFRLKDEKNIYFIKGLSIIEKVILKQ